VEHGVGQTVLTACETVELLRLKHRTLSRDTAAAARAGARAAAAGGSDADMDIGNTADRDAGSTVMVAALRWSEARRGALCCLTRGSATWLVLIRDGLPPALGAVETDRMLLGALNSSEPGDSIARPDMAWARLAARRAVHAVRAARTAAVVDAAGGGAAGPDRGGRGGSGRGGSGRARIQRQDPTRRRVLGALHRWTACRPGGATAAECAAADRVIAALDCADGAGLRQLLTSLADTATDTELIGKLVTSGSRDATRGQRSDNRSATAPLRLRAVLVLAPEDPPDGRPIG
jgi:hypothetical protein